MFNQIISHFTSCVIDIDDAGVSGVKYTTHVDAVIKFMHVNFIFIIIEELFLFATLYIVRDTLTVISYSSDSDFIHTFASVSF
jgi:hypothetical protein